MNFKFQISSGHKYGGVIASEIQTNMNRVSIYQKYNVKFNDRFYITANNDLPFVIEYEGTTMGKLIGMEERKDIVSEVICNSKSSLPSLSVCMFPKRALLQCSEIQVRLPELINVFESGDENDLCCVIDATGLFPTYRQSARECTVGADLPTLKREVNGFKVKLVDENGFGLQFNKETIFSMMFRIELDDL